MNWVPDDLPTASTYTIYVYTISRLYLKYFAPLCYNINNTYRVTFLLSRTVLPSAGRDSGDICFLTSLDPLHFFRPRDNKNGSCPLKPCNSPLSMLHSRLDLHIPIINLMNSFYSRPFRHCVSIVFHRGHSDIRSKYTISLNL